MYIHTYIHTYIHKQTRTHSYMHVLSNVSDHSLTIKCTSYSVPICTVATAVEKVYNYEVHFFSTIRILALNICLMILVSFNFCS